jgi:hypothetical protein
MSSDPRARRVGESEALFRTVNEQIESTNKGLAGLSDGRMHVVCECADLACAATIPVELDDYERIRGDSALFIVKPGHVARDVEHVVEDMDGYEVVRKRPGDPQAIARATDPRRP